MIPNRTIFLIGLVPSLLWVAPGCTGERTSGSAENAVDREAVVRTAADASGTLRAIMQGLRTDMIRLTDGVWTGSFEQVAEAAEAVADHPQVSPAERQRIQAALGEEFPTFVAADRHVHDLALRVREAAEREDTVAVLGALAELQEGCIACHSSFRQRLIGQ